MLEAGQVAPLFSLPDADMETFDLASFRGQQIVVLFFYVRNNTPTCTQEVAEFSDRETEFLRHDCAIIGISRDSCQRHTDFREAQGLSVRLLSDLDSEVSRQYDVCRIKEVDGEKKQCVVRSTFVIDKQGIIRHALYDVTPRGHAAEVYQLVKELESNANREKHSRHAQLQCDR